MEICIRCDKPTDNNTQYGLHEACFAEWFGLPKTQEFIDLDPKNTESSSGSPEIKKKKDTFFHGRYLKFSARLNNQEYILKIQEDEFPDLPGMEYTCNRIAKILAIPVPAFYYIEFNGRPTFVTRNFMQDHVGTLNHIYKYLPEGEENHSCEKIVETILTQTRRLSDVARFVDICLFDTLIGNQDRHGRNLGIIDTTKGRMLAPSYDNPSYFGTVDDFMLGAHLNPSGTIWTSISREPKPLDYIEEFTKMGHARIITNFKRRLFGRFTDIADEINESPINDKRKKSFLKFVEERAEEFEIE